MSLVLVAEDEEGIRRLVCMAIESAGHRCLAAANGLEAVALFRSNSDSIDLVITDLVMPVMGGAEAIARIRETKFDVPVICMSGYTDIPMLRGVRGLHKPFTVSALLKLVKEILD